jgi:hypothetical protein
MREGLQRLACALACTGVVAGAAFAAARIARVYVDEAERVHVVEESGREVLPPKLDGQISASDAKLAEDAQTSGWLVNFENCCTSYPIPLALVIFRDSRIRREIKPGLMIYDWDFREHGRQAALCDGTVHGNPVAHCALYETLSGKKVGEWGGNGNPPAWVGKLRFE